MPLDTPVITTDFCVLAIVNAPQIPVDCISQKSPVFNELYVRS
jgi:hypothetical protein